MIYLFLVSRPILHACIMRTYGKRVLEINETCTRMKDLPSLILLPYPVCFGTSRWTWSRADLLKMLEGWGDGCCCRGKSVVGAK